MSNKPKFFWGKHKRLWDILAHTGGKNKEEALKTMGEDRFPELKCFACDARAAYLREKGENDGPCPVGSCPLDWGVRLPFACSEVGRLYDRWSKEKTVEERKHFAALIRDLPLSENAREMYEVIDD